jgi:hypothetical protein
MRKIQKFKNFYLIETDKALLEMILTTVILIKKLQNNIE